MTIRDALAADIPAVAALEKICFPADPWPEDMIARSIGRFLLAVEGDDLLGCAVLSTVLDEGSLDSIAVSPARRRSGVADGLLAEVIRRAKKQALTVLFLEVRAGNGPAIALYEKHGFLSVGRRKNYYEKPREDAILMTLVL